MSVMSGHIDLRTRMERFLHTTWLGGVIVRGFWKTLARNSKNVLGLPNDSPLRCTHSIFWDTRTNDEGVPREGSFHSLANAGKINIISPARAASFGDDGKSVVLDDGSTVPASAVILATGYKSTWRPIFDDETIEYLGLGQRPSNYEPKTKVHWDYTSFADPPTNLENTPWAAPVYRGLVPAKNILNRDFAINGASVVLFTLWLCPRSLTPHVIPSINSLRPTMGIFLRSPLIGSRRTSAVTTFGFHGAWMRPTTWPIVMLHGCDGAIHIP
jgi:dimethylaniline monooxygenase (N-oxide forming)